MKVRRYCLLLFAVVYPALLGAQDQPAQDTAGDQSEHSPAVQQTAPPDEDAATESAIPILTEQEDVIAETVDETPEKPKSKITIRYDDSGMMIIEGLPKHVSNFEYVYKRLLEEAAKTYSPKPDIRVFKPKYIDVSLAAAILDEAFNETSRARLAAQQAALRRQQQAQRRGRQPTRTGRQQANQPEEPEEDSRPTPPGLADLGSLLGLGGTDDSTADAFKTLSDSDQGITVFPEPQRGLLVIKAPTQLFPTVVDLLYKIDSPASVEREFTIVALQKLDAEEVQAALEELLGLEEQTRATSRRPTPRRANQRRGAQDAAALALELQQQMMQIGSQGEGFSTKDVRISSLAASNSMIVFGPKEARESIVAMIERLDEQGSATRVESYALENADASSLARTLQSAYGGGSQTRGENVVITADDSTNTIFVNAPDTVRQEIALRIAESEGQASEFNPRTISLLQGDAQTIALIVKEIFSGRKSGKAKITIAADTSSNQLIVSAPDEIFDEIKRLTSSLDQADPSQVLPKIYKLQYASAAEAKTQIQDMVTQLGRSAKATGTPMSGMGAFGVTADEATNSLVVMGTPTTFAVIEQVLREVDQKPADPSRRATETVPLVTGDAREVAGNINKLYGGRKIQGVDPPKAEANLSANAVVIEGTQRQRDEIKSFIESLEAIAPEGGEIKTYTIQLEYVDADQAAETVNSYFNQYFDALKRGGAKGIKESEMTVTVVPDTLSDKLFVNATEHNKAKIDEILAAIDTPEAGRIETRVTEVFQLKFADPGQTANAINQAFQKRGRVPEKELVNAVAEWATSSVMVTASGENLDRIRKMLEQLDVGGGKQQVLQVVELADARAADVANTVNQHLQQTRVRSRRGQLPVSVVPNENTNSLILSGSEEEVTQIKGLIDTLDVPTEAEAGRYIKVYRIRYANPWAVWNAINQAFNVGRGIKEEDRVNAGMDGDTSTIIVTASKERHDEIQKMIDDIDKESDSIRTFRILDITHGDASEISAALNEVIRGQRSERGQTKPTVTANASTNSLIVYANESEMADFQPLIDSMDAEDVVGTAPQRIMLTHQNASQLADLLTRVFTDPAKQRGRGRGGQTEVPVILADDATNSLIVRAQEKDYNEIVQMVQELDQEDLDNGPAGVKIIQVADGVAVADLARTIEDTIRKGEEFKQKKDRNYQPSYVAIGADDRTNALIVAGSSAQFDEVERLVRTLEKMKPSGPTSIRVINIKNIKSSELIQVLDQMTEKRNQQRGGRRRR